MSLNRVLAAAVACALTACGPVVPIRDPQVQAAAVPVSLDAGWIGLRFRVVSRARCVDGVCDSSGAACMGPLDCGYGAVLQERCVAPDSGTEVGLTDLPRHALHVEVEALGAQGQQVGRGASRAFVPPDLALDPGVRLEIAVRPVEVFVALPARLSEPRAGHTATLLDDGRVLFAGGFDTDPGRGAGTRDPQSWTFTASAEILDPTTGELAPVPAMNSLGASTRRAFHTATAVGQGTVLVVGGEYRLPGGGMATQPAALLFDQDSEVWATHPSRIARSRHSAFASPLGRVQLLGGLAWTNGEPDFAHGFEQWDPATNAVRRSQAGSVDWETTALGQAGVSLEEGESAALVGGVQERSPSPSVIRFFSEKEGRLGAAGETGLLLPRVNPAVGGSGKRYLVAGGFTELRPDQPWDLFPSRPTGQTEVLDLSGSTPTTSPGPTLDVPRGQACAVALRDGRVLVAGGRGGARGEAVPDVALFRDLGVAESRFTFGRLALGEARYFHTCTLLEDGSVLIAGGVQEGQGGLRTLDTLELFVPRT